MHCSVTRHILKRLIPIFLLLLAALCLPGLANEGSKGGSSKMRATKAPFAFSMDDISDSLVTVSCKNNTGYHASNGYIARMDGETYLFTRQHILFGAKKISFKTLSGTTLRPLGVELSASRDIARLLLDIGAAGFEVSDEVSMDSLICIPENGATDGIVNKFTGKIIGVGPETVEVSARFAPKNSGSPVLNSDLEVLGITSYIMEPGQDDVTKKGTQFEYEPRWFCYRMANTHWKPVDWRMYNLKYGRFYHENVVFTEQANEIAFRLANAPTGKIYAMQNLGHDLASWARSFNGIVAKRGKPNQNKQAFATEYTGCIKKLSGICRARAQKIQAFSEERGLTPFLRRELQLQTEMLDSTVGILNHISTYGKDCR